jgi:hypothetical protein
MNPHALDHTTQKIAANLITSTVHTHTAPLQYLPHDPDAEIDDGFFNGRRVCGYEPRTS